MVSENAAFVALVPFWAVWPFEILISSRRHTGTLSRLTHQEVPLLAQILKQVTSVYDRVFDAPFPYSMGFHQSPDRRRPAPGMALSRAFLSATSAFRVHPEVHGRVRDARNTAAGHHRRERGRASAVARARTSASRISGTAQANAVVFYCNRLHFQARRSGARGSAG